jgi:hypothetical protein
MAHMSYYCILTYLKNSNHRKLDQKVILNDPRNVRGLRLYAVYTLTSVYMSTNAPLTHACSNVAVFIVHCSISCSVEPHRLMLHTDAT